MTPKTLKKIITLLSLSLAIFAFAAQSLFAGEIIVTNNSNAHLFISFMQANRSQQWRTPTLKPGGSAKDLNVAIKDGVLEIYNHKGDLAYHLGLDMEANGEIQDGTEAIQIYSTNSNDDVSWDSLKTGTEVTNTHTFYTLKAEHETQVVRNLTVIFKYNKTTGQLNVTIK